MKVTLVEPRDERPSFLDAGLSGALRSGMQDLGIDVRLGDGETTAQRAAGESGPG